MAAFRAPGCFFGDTVVTAVVTGWLVVIREDSHRRRVEIVELARADRPHEDPGHRDDRDDGDPDEEWKDLHRGQCPCASGERPRRSAFPATTSELRDMPIAAAQGGTAPAAARGSATRL